MLEILLVIASIGLLVAIVIVAINPTRQLAQVRDGERIVELRSLNDALSQYTIDNNGSFPAGLSDSYIEVCAEGAADCTDRVDLDSLVPDYLSSIPVDPSHVDANGTGYFVRVENGRVVTRAPDSEQDVIGINKELDDEIGGLFVWGDNLYG